MIPNSRMMGGGDQGSIAWRPGHTLPRKPQVVGGANQQVLNGQHNVLVGTGAQSGGVQHDDTPAPAIDGEPGTAGANGIDGTNGINGANGTNGTDGIDGIDGVDGVDGTNADCAGYLPVGDKGASLQTRAGDVKVLAVEAPQFLIIDVMQVNGQIALLDPVFLDCVEPDSVQVLSCHIAGRANCYATICCEAVRVHINPWHGKLELLPAATVTVAGLRKGSREVRFPPATAFEVEKSTEFLRRCLGELPPHPSALGESGCC